MICARMTNCLWMNTTSKTKTLSLKAKGLFSLMLDKMKEVPDWNFTIRNLAELNKDGIEAVGNAVRELEQAGYVERHRTYSQRDISVVYDISCTGYH